MHSEFLKELSADSVDRSKIEGEFSSERLEVFIEHLVICWGSGRVVSLFTLIVLREMNEVSELKVSVDKSWDGECHSLFTSGQEHFTEAVQHVEVLVSVVVNSEMHNSSNQSLLGSELSWVRVLVLRVVFQNWDKEVDQLVHNLEISEVD